MGIIYGLFDPITSELRYIGKTVGKLSRRLTKHLSPAELRKPSHRVNWIKSLIKVNLKPYIKALKICEDSSLVEAEKFLIAYYRELGFNLTNMTDGGEGMVGYRHTEAAKIKIAEFRTGKTASKETRKKMSEAKKGKNHNFYGKSLSIEHKLKIASSLMGRKGNNHSQATIEKIAKSKGSKEFLAKNNKNILSFVSIKQASRVTKLDKKTISNILKGHREPYKGWNFEYVQ